MDSFKLDRTAFKGQTQKEASKLNVISGTIIINNTSGSTKTYYYRTDFIDIYDGGSSSVTFFNFGKSTWSENSIVAYPMN
jgi:hypothetical protein